ncbi:MAG: class I SAM-dependent methyltransferase [Candidatus Sumerlaeota bacterium]|nr:class I SAM-dependent methyltransferase [Candidatus Sumerlaeota bacterium]
MKQPLRDTFWIYEGLRKLFLLGLNIRPILKALDAKPGEQILDVGCGFGFFHKYLSGCDYVGVDSDPIRIQWALDRIGIAPGRKFLVGDACRMDFPDKAFDKALGYGLLHHLSDEDADRCLEELTRLAKGRIVFSDPVYSKWHFVNNVLCRLDRGSFVRTPGAYLDLCQHRCRVESSNFFYSNNRLAKYFLMTVSDQAKQLPSVS